jgi:hypothetical protein
MHGIQSSIIAIAVHPRKPILAIAGSTGWVSFWDYNRKTYAGESYELYSKEIREK